jgi:hypothetical protein
VPNLQEAVWLIERQRPQQNRIDHAEYGRVCANSDGKRQDSNGRKPRTFSQQTDSVAQVLPEVAHVFFLAAGDTRVAVRMFPSRLLDKGSVSEGLNTSSRCATYRILAVFWNQNGVLES